MSGHFSEWRSKLSSNEKAAIGYYTDAGYSYINNELRSGANPSSIEEVRHLMRALAKSPGAPDDIMVYRGVHFDPLETDEQLYKMLETGKMQPGDIMVDAGFVSTTVSKSVATEMFAESGKYGSVLFEISVPKGTPGAYVGDLSANKSEQEFLMPPGSSFYIHSIEKWGKGYKVKMTALQEIGQKGDYPGHPFRGNQYTTVGAFTGKISFRTSGPEARAESDGSISFNIDKLRSLGDDSISGIVAHEIAHHTVEEYVLRNQEEWDLAVQNLKIAELGNGMQLFFGGNTKIGEAISDAVSVVVTGASKPERLSDDEFDRIRKYITGLVNRAGYSMNDLRNLTREITEKVSFEISWQEVK